MMPAAQDSIVLQAERVSRVFGRGAGAIWAVREVSFVVAQGECVALVGESGSGKTTLARMIVGLTEPSGGRVLFEGEDVARLAARRATRKVLAAGIQMVFQDPYSSLDPSMTVAEIIGEPLRILGSDRKAARQRAAEVLTLVGLPEDFGARRPRELSGGQRQRVGIARALGPRPRMLLLDEPVASLDVSIQGQILKLLKDIQRQTGISALVIAHDLGVVRAIADRTLVMYLGSVVEAGPTEEIFERPMHPYTAALLWSATARGRAGMSSAVRTALAQEALPASERGVGCAFRSRCWQSVPRCAAEVDRADGSRGHWAGCNVPLPRLGEKVRVS